MALEIGGSWPLLTHVDNLTVNQIVTHISAFLSSVEYRETSVYSVVETGALPVDSALSRVTVQALIVTAPAG
jgi:ABC-type antimicrobial peptide transport system permease subunit